jgi:hypothetical protein
MDLGDFEVLWVWEILAQQTKQNKTNECNLQ